MEGEEFQVEEWKKCKPARYLCYLHQQIGYVDSLILWMYFYDGRKELTRMIAVVWMPRSVKIRYALCCRNTCCQCQWWWTTDGFCGCHSLRRTEIVLEFISGPQAITWNTIYLRLRIRLCRRGQWLSTSVTYYIHYYTKCCSWACQWAPSAEILKKSI